jgi:hypothetical protein
MAGNINYQLSFGGVKEAIQDLTKINTLLDSITGHKGNDILLGKTGDNTGGQNNTSGGGSSVGSNLTGDVVLGASIIKQGASLNQASRNLNDAAKTIRSGFTKRETSIMDAVMKSGGLGIGRQSLKSNDILNQAINNVGKLPIPDPSGGGSGGSGGGNTFKNLWSSFSEFNGKLKSISKLFLEFAPIIGLVTGAMYQLNKGIQSGTEAVLHAAKLGGSVESTSNLQSALNQMGIKDAPTMQMQMTAQAGGNSQAIMGAGMSSGFGATSQLINLNKQFAEALRDSTDSARQLSVSSKINYMDQMNLSAVGREWKTTLSLMAAIMHPVIDVFSNIIKEFLKFTNFVMEQLLWWVDKLGLPTGDKSGENRIAGMGNAKSPTSGWESMGFNMNQGGPDKKLAEIAKNTSDIARNTTPTKYSTTSVGSQYQGSWSPVYKP